MHPADKKTENLFTYGTLQVEEVQLTTFGRRLQGKPDALAGYRLIIVRIEDQDFVVTSGSEYHRNVQLTSNPSDVVEGVVFKVTQKELELSDAYEPTGYEREQVKLSSGLEAWVYRLLT